MEIGIKKAQGKCLLCAFFVSDGLWPLEGQVVGSSFASRLLCRREGGCCGIGGRLLGRERSGSGSWTTYSRGSRNAASCLAANNVISANLIKPTSIILMGVNIKLYCDFLTSLNTELFNAILSK